MKKAMSIWCSGTIVVLLMLALVTGCSSKRSAGVAKAISDIESMEEIADKYNLYNLSDYEGVALISLGKYPLGYFVVTAMGWSASVYVKDPVKKEFGPPSFVSAGGLSAGLAAFQVNAFDCLILFKNRDDAIKFAKRSVNLNVSSEGVWLAWGYKVMMIPGSDSFSDGIGVGIALVELELLFGGSRDTLHENMYGKGVTVDKIFLNDVTIPDDLKAGLERLNLLMQR
ncbi:hypothetical protein VU01_10519 [Candidatus Electrothrix marina]|uniref:Lipid-binding SYLF domain-containing protein n=1 Tax=Candidatus Electrothrix marina TaxID=1859130 RepID=A0A444JFW9_9BACT|nr:hypothetical protein VU01_10519 [Candidatus Electrothrix marina]